MGGEDVLRRVEALNGARGKHHEQNAAVMARLSATGDVEDRLDVLFAEMLPHLYYPRAAPRLAPRTPPPPPNPDAAALVVPAKPPSLADHATRQAARRPGVRGQHEIRRVTLETTCRFT